MTTIFTNPNDRVFYACMGVMYLERQTTDGSGSGGTAEPENMNWLNGVQSIGVDQSQARTTMLDIGRSQRKYGTYGKQEFTITIERLLTNAKNDDGTGNINIRRGISSFFYNVDGNTSYTDTHILKSSNLGFSGFNNTLRNYDITLIYAPDRFKRLGSEKGGSSDPDDEKYLTTIYRCCLLTGINYNIPVQGPVTETLTFTTHVANQMAMAGDWDDLNEADADEAGDTIRRHNIDTTNSVLPLEVRRMFDLGTSETDIPILGLQSIDVGATINYSDIMDVGQWRGSNLSGDAVSSPPKSEPAGSADLRAEQNLYRQVILPIEITCNFTGVVRAQYRGQPTGSPSFDDDTDGTKYQAFENTDTTFTASDGNDSKTLGTGKDSRYEVNREILIAAQKDSNYFQWNLGKRNYLEDMSYSGGDTGGSNVEATLSYKNSVSDFVLLKSSSIVDISPPTYDNGLPIYY